MVVIHSALLPRRVKKYLVEEDSSFVIVCGNLLLHSPKEVHKRNFFHERASFPHICCKWLNASNRQEGERDAASGNYFNAQIYGVGAVRFWETPGNCLVSAADDGEIFIYAHDWNFESGPGMIQDEDPSDCFKAYFPAAWRALALCCPHPKFLKYSPQTYCFKWKLFIDAAADAEAIRECRFFADGSDVMLEEFLCAALKLESRLLRA